MTPGWGGRNGGRALHHGGFVGRRIGWVGLLLYRRSIVKAKLVTQLEVRRNPERVVQERTAC